MIAVKELACVSKTVDALARLLTTLALLLTVWPMVLTSVWTCSTPVACSMLD